MRALRALLETRDARRVPGSPAPCPAAPVPPLHCRVMKSRDTDDRARQVQRAAQRALGPARRVELVIEMSERARAVAVSGLMKRHPELTHGEARARLVRRLLGDALFEAAWPRPTPR